MQHKRPQALLFLRVPRTRAQEQDTEARELSFLERLALLVDRQWNWRQNQALARRLHAAKLRGNACVEDIDFRASRGLDKSAIRALAHESASVRNHEHLFARLEWERVSLRARWLRKPAGWILPSVHSGRGAVSRSTAKLSRIGVFVIEGDGAAERERSSAKTGVEPDP